MPVVYNARKATLSAKETAADCVARCSSNVSARCRHHHMQLGCVQVTARFEHASHTETGLKLSHFTLSLCEYVLLLRPSRHYALFSENKKIMQAKLNNEMSAMQCPLI